MTVPLDPLLQWLLRGLLAFVLLRAAWHKARDPRAFRVALADYELLPRSWLAGAAPGLVGAETLAAAALLLPATAVGGARAAAGLLALYSAAIAVNLLRGRRGLDCGCSGPAGGTPIGAGLLVRNGVLVALALASLAPATARPLGAVDAWTGGLGLAVASLLYVAVELALAHAPRLRTLRSAA